MAQQDCTGSEQYMWKLGIYSSRLSLLINARSEHRTLQFHPMCQIAMLYITIMRSVSAQKGPATQTKEQMGIESDYNSGRVK